MKRAFIALIAPMALLAACTADVTPPEPVSVPTMGQISIDEQAIRFGFVALDTAASAADLLIAVGKLKPGSAAALRVAEGLQSAQAWLNAASGFQRAGRAGNAIDAWKKAQASLVIVKTTLDAFK